MNNKQHYRPALWSLIFITGIHISLAQPVTALTVSSTPVVSLTPASQSQTQTQFTRVGDAETAQHWGLTEAEWATYQKYMAIEGKYFYAHLDPLMTLGIIESDNQARQRYAQLWLMQERQRVEAQVSFSNLVARVQHKLFGNEPYMDFSQLPWEHAQQYAPDAPTIKHSPLINTPSAASTKQTEQQGEQHTLSQNDNTAAPIAAPIEGAAPLDLSFQPTDELWITVMECDRCAEQIKALLAQPLNIVIHGMADAEALVAYAKAAHLPQEQVGKRITLRLFDPLSFGGREVRAGEVFHARNGHVLRQL